MATSSTPERPSCGQIRDARAEQFYSAGLRAPTLSPHQMLFFVQERFLPCRAAANIRPHARLASARRRRTSLDTGVPAGGLGSVCRCHLIPNGPPVCRRNSMSSSSQISRAVRQALVLGAVAAAGSLPAVAQEQAVKPVEVETITVTGSRIPQPQLESVSPVTTVNAEQIQQSGVTRVEDLLNKLPQVAAQFGSGDSNGATGEATV